MLTIILVILALLIMGSLIHAFLYILEETLYDQDCARAQHNSNPSAAKDTEVNAAEGEEVGIASVIGWLFVYTKHLTTCLYDLWRIKFKRSILRINNLFETCKNAILKKYAATSARSKQSTDFLNKMHVRKTLARKPKIQSPLKTTCDQLLLLLCSTENQIKLKKKAHTDSK